MVAVRLTETDELDDVIAHLMRLREEIQTGMDDTNQVITELNSVGEDFEAFVSDLRRVLGA